MSEPLKVTFDRELTFEGKTFEKEAVYGKPRIDQYYVDDMSRVSKAYVNFSVLTYPILTEKKKIYTLIKVEGDVQKIDRVYSWSDQRYHDVVSIKTVEE